MAVAEHKCAGWEWSGNFHSGHWHKSDSLFPRKRIGLDSLVCQQPVLLARISVELAVRPNSGCVGPASQSFMARRLPAIPAQDHGRRCRNRTPCRAPHGRKPAVASSGSDSSKLNRDFSTHRHGLGVHRSKILAFARSGILKNFFGLLIETMGANQSCTAHKIAGCDNPFPFQNRFSLSHGSASLLMVLNDAGHCKLCGRQAKKLSRHPGPLLCK